MNLKDKEFRPWMGGYYMVSADGYIYVTQSGRGGVAGRFLLPIWQNGTSTVNIRVNGRAKQTAMSTATLEVWGERIKSTEASVDEMRAAICAYHAEFLPLVTQAKKDAISKSLLEKNDGLRSVMPCPWQTGKLDTLPPGVASWDDPIMDPMSSGFPMITFSVSNAAREVAASLLILTTQPVLGEDWNLWITEHAVDALAALVGEEKKYSREKCPKSDTWFANGGACGKAWDCRECKDTPVMRRPEASA